MVEPFVTILFNVCSAVTVECCVFVSVLRGYVWYICCYVRKKALLPGIERRDMGLYEMSLSIIIMYLYSTSIQLPAQDRFYEYFFPNQTVT